LPRAQHASSDNSLEITDKEVLPKSIGNESLLVVDDEKEIINIVTDILRAQGYKVYAASDGEQALKVLNQHPDIDILLSDVVMPGGINGYELAEQARSKHSNIKVLLSSGYTAKAMKIDDKKNVQYSLLKKPYKSQDLVKKVRAILDGAIEPQVH
jgi:CheY-like chemotaxis protein